MEIDLALILVLSLGIGIPLVRLIIRELIRLSRKRGLQKIIDKLVSEAEGMVGIREWYVTDGRLQSIFVGSHLWQEFNKSDEVPTKSNRHGLYAVGYHSNILKPRISYDAIGLVDLTGIIEEHADGVLRAEEARILCILTKSRIDTKLLKQNYPNTLIIGGAYGY